MRNEQAPDADAADDDSGSDSYMSLGIVFAILGVVFFLTMDNGAVGLPFFVLGIVFFASWVGRSRGSDPGADDT